jgi:hypothetical protein
MSTTNPRRDIHNLIDNLSDTKSWAQLANELEKYAGNVGDTPKLSGGETIEMKDLLCSLDEQDDTLEK